MCESVVRDIVEENLSAGGSLLSRQPSAAAPGQRHQFYTFNPVYILTSVSILAAGYNL